MNSNQPIRKWLLMGGGLGGLLLLIFAARMIGAGAHPPEHDHVVGRADFALWSPFEGTIQAEHRAPIYSRISQPAVVLMLAAEGRHVEAGDLVAELDRSALDQMLVALERDHALAAAELETLLQAEIPMERDTLTHEWNTLKYDALKQRRIVDNTQKLQASGLVSDSELEAQMVLLANLEQQIAFMDTRRDHLNRIVHPAREAKARAQWEASRRQLELMQEQAEGARLTAPIAGMVVYLPLHIDGEFRNAREGDTIFRNQKIMQIADMASLMVQCLTPESSISLVRPGYPAVVTPTAFPDLQLDGVVDSVGSVAMSVSGRPAWQKYFNVTLRLDAGDPRLRSSMSVVAQILSFHESDAVVVPRHYVGWDRGQPWCLVRQAGKQQRRDLELGPGNERFFPVQRGLSPGDIVVRPDRRS